MGLRWGLRLWALEGGPGDQAGTSKLVGALGALTESVPPGELCKVETGLDGVVASGAMSVTPGLLRFSFAFGNE